MEFTSDKMLKELENIFESYEWWKEQDGAEEIAERFSVKLVTCKEFAEKVTGRKIVSKDGKFAWED